MLGIYFSGTGNTRHAVERFVTAIDNSAKSLSIEDCGVLGELAKHEMIVFGFPVYYSNIPKIAKAAEKFKASKRQKRGLNPLNYIIGFFLKILWFYPKTDSYISAPKVNAVKCNGCGLCVKLCPTQNLKIADDKAVSGSKCTVCYRCFGNCPTRALTVLGDKIYGQYNFKKEAS